VKKTPRSSQLPALVALAAALLVALTPACSKSESSGKAPAPSGSASAKYTAKGKVRAVGERKDNITIAHEDIPGYMKAMTMMFEVEKPEIIGDVKVGDDVTFTFSDREGRLFIESITHAK